MVRPIRRIVAGNDERGIAVALSDGPSPDVRLDSARPGFAMTRLWVQETTPARAKGVRETLHLPHTIEPPPGGSLCRAVEFPPEAPYIGKVGEQEVRAWYAAMGSPGARVPGGPHPVHAAHRLARFLLGLRGQDHTRARHRRGASEGRRSGHPARGEPRLEQPLRQAMPSSSCRSMPGRGCQAPVRPPVAAEPPKRPTRQPAADCAAWIAGNDAQGRSGVLVRQRGAQLSFRARPAPACTNCGPSIRCRPVLPAIPMPALPVVASCIRRRPRARVGVSPIRRPSELRSNGKWNKRSSTPRTRPAARSGWMAHATRACVAGRRSTTRCASKASGVWCWRNSVVIRAGDVVIQLGNWHAWAASEARLGKDGIRWTPPVMSVSMSRRTGWMSMFCPAARLFLSPVMRSA